MFAKLHDQIALTGEDWVGQAIALTTGSSELPSSFEGALQGFENMPQIHVAWQVLRVKRGDVNGTLSVRVFFHEHRMSLTRDLNREAARSGMDEDRRRPLGRIFLAGQAMR